MLRIALVMLFTVALVLGVLDLSDSAGYLLIALVVVAAFGLGLVVMYAIAFGDTQRESVGVPSTQGIVTK